MSTLNYRSREATPVVRSKMLLELQDVAAELDIERTDVLRLIARGNLKSRVVGADKLRIERSAIETLLRQDVELEIGEKYNDWFDSRAEELRAGEMVGKIKHAIAAVIPETDPGADQVVRYTRRIAEAGNATP
ncbi:MAG: helix-turn-helix domain-containing protein, partial [Fuerstiella sp.]|nr:helix-turn-helix domain-containing protein [Fuerstiella sp.]